MVWYRVNSNDKVGYAWCICPCSQQEDSIRYKFRGSYGATVGADQDFEWMKVVVLLLWKKLIFFFLLLIMYHHHLPRIIFTIDDKEGFLLRGFLKVERGTSRQCQPSVAHWVGDVASTPLNGPPHLLPLQCTPSPGPLHNVQERSLGAEERWWWWCQARMPGMHELNHATCTCTYQYTILYKRCSRGADIDRCTV